MSCPENESFQLPDKDALRSVRQIFPWSCREKGPFDLSGRCSLGTVVQKLPLISPADVLLELPHKGSL